MATKIKFDEVVKNKRLTDIEDTKESAISIYRKKTNTLSPSFPVETQKTLRWFL